MPHFKKRTHSGWFGSATTPTYVLEGTVGQHGFARAGATARCASSFACGLIGQSAGTYANRTATSAM